MAGNGLLMKALMTLRQKLANNVIDSKEYKNSLKLANYGNEILHWNKPNPFNQNYANFIDYVDNPRFLRKRIRISPQDGSMGFKLASKFLQFQSKFSFLKR